MEFIAAILHYVSFVFITQIFLDRRMSILRILTNYASFSVNMVANSAIFLSLFCIFSIFLLFTHGSIVLFSDLSSFYIFGCLF